jgi:peptidyl-prolyl cis-trans isomerase SurA
MRLKATLLMALFAVGAVAQQQADPTVMTVNGHEIARSEFEYFLNRDSVVTDETHIKECADEFAIRKLKVLKALEMGLDTSVAVRAEIDNYRGALAKSYLTDDTAEEQEARSRYKRLSSNLSQGYVRVSRIFRRMPQNITGRTMQRYEQQMDSIYGVLQKEPLLFSDFVVRFSDDKQTSDVRMLQTTEEYEKRIFSMKENEISRPFFTPEGLQIVKVIARGELPDYEGMKEELKGQMTHRTTKSVVERMKSECGFRENEKTVKSLLNGQDTSDDLFTIGSKSFTGADFSKFAATYPRLRATQYDAFVTKCLMDYESNHMEELHPEHDMNIKVHTESVLVAELDKQSIPSAEEYANGLNEYFEKNRSEYKWDEPKYRGVAVRCADNATAKKIKKELKRVPLEQWPDTVAKRYTADGKNTAKAEYALFSRGDNDVVDFMVYGSPTVNPSGDYPCAFVAGKKQKMPESVEEAGEAVKTDYKNHLKAQSVKHLKQGSQVEIKQEVLKTVNNH